MSIILLYSAITGLIFSFILLLYNRGIYKANRYLAGFFFFISLFILSQYSGLYGKSEVLAAIVGSGPTPFVFLIGPLSYFYVRSVMRDNTKLSHTDYLHFLLFALQFAGMVSYYASSWEYKLSVARILISDEWQVTNLNLNKIFASPINSYLRPLHILVYVVAQWYLIGKYYQVKQRPRIPQLQNRRIRRWLILFTVVITCFLLCYVLLSVHLLIYETKPEFQAHSTVLLLFASLSAVALNISVLLFPEILYGLPKMYAEVPVVQPDSQELIAGTTAQSTAPVADTKTAWVMRIEQKLSELYKHSQPWTDKNFSVNTLAILIHEPVHHLRYYFSQHLKVSFPAYRNKLRVDYAKLLLEDNHLRHLSVEGVGAKAGFSSKSSFFAVFRQLTGLTPAQYLEKRNNEKDFPA